MGIASNGLNSSIVFALTILYFIFFSLISILIIISSLGNRHTEYNSVRFCEYNSVRLVRDDIYAVWYKYPFDDNAI
mgnify:CR=1 FL=1